MASQFVFPDLPETAHSPKIKPIDGRNAFELKLLATVKAAIIVTDGQGVITYWNPFAEELYGWPAREVVGRRIMEITVGTETEQDAKAHMDALHTGKSWTGEFQVRCRDGKFLTALVTLSPLLDPSGAVTGIVGVSQDLTERKLVEEELRNAQSELEKRVQHRTAQLDKANRSLRDLSGRLMQMRDEERRRMARDLHDSAGQVLAAISMNIAVVKAQAHLLDQAGASAVADNTLLVKQLTEEIRTLSYLLHPPLLDEAGLASALQCYVEGFAQRSRIKITLDIPSDFGRLSSELEIAVFRTVQECLTNIHRHSGSSDAVINLHQEDGGVVVVVRDTGKGVPSQLLPHLNTDGGGVGFRGMRERLRHLGGSLLIDSGSHGTTVTMTLPLDAASPVAEDLEVA